MTWHPLPAAETLHQTTKYMCTCTYISIFIHVCIHKITYLCVHKVGGSTRAQHQQKEHQSRQIIAGSKNICRGVDRRRNIKAGKFTQKVEMNVDVLKVQSACIPAQSILLMP